MRLEVEPTQRRQVERKTKLPAAEGEAEVVDEAEDVAEAEEEEGQKRQLESQGTPVHRE